MHPDVGQHLGVGKLQPGAELDPEPPQDVGGHFVAVRDDQDEIALLRRGLRDQGSLHGFGKELGDRPLDLAVRLEREVGEALRPETPGAVGQLVDLPSGHAGHARGHDRLDAAATGKRGVEDAKP